MTVLGDRSENTGGPLKYRIVVLPGDHVGREVTAAAEKVLELIASLSPFVFELVHGAIGGAAIEKYGAPLPKSTVDMINHPDTRAILLGAVGGPQWEKLEPASNRPEQALLQLRRLLNCYANLRPLSFPSKSLADCSPLSQRILSPDNLPDFIVLRELCGGIYFGEKQDDGEKASDVQQYSVEEITRITRVAGHLARQLAKDRGWPVAKVSSVDKANVLASSRLWRRTVSDIMAKEFPDIHLIHYYVDAAAMHMIRNPSMFNGVLLTGNLFGDILSDEASVIVGSLGLLPSASLCGWPKAAQVETRPGLYEPIHGSAPDISGLQVANPVGAILSVALMLRYSLGLPDEAQAVENAVRTVLDSTALGGFGLRTRDLGGKVGTVELTAAVCKVLRERLGYLRAQQFRQSLSLRTTPPPLSSSTFSNAAETGKIITTPFGRRPMTVCEKIIAHHCLDLPTPGDVRPGDVCCVRVDWTLASELTWKGMEKTYAEMKRPPLWRTDRFWLAVDHTVDPSINDQPKPRELIQTAQQFAQSVSLADYRGPNETILHTDFYRDRVQPGQLVIGADSHTCSAGGLGALAIGLGAADVVMPLVTGQTWLRVPETVEIRFVGRPPFGIGGKDIILWVLGELRRNTVAFERAVEFTGPGCRYLSCDARFAIANMTTEFGGIAGVFAGDEQSAAYISGRDAEEHRNSAIYFQADPGAQYAETFQIDLCRVDSMLALYPSPDNVVRLRAVVGMPLDGVFIGACTTAEDDLILAALVLQAGLQAGLLPSLSGRRKVTPGSRAIVRRLEQLGLLDVYRRAGFEVGAPGCSYCLGIAADRAGDGEIWLSSQNRNFHNRMGRGSIGNLASAAAVAASSFDMRVTDPRPLLDRIDIDRYHSALSGWLAIDDKALKLGKSYSNCSSVPVSEKPLPAECSNNVASATFPSLFRPLSTAPTVCRGRVQRFEDNIDTDAIIPAEFMPGKSDKDLGSHCFQYTRPEFRQRCSEGFNIVVAGTGFGSGSSREEAPRALKGCGVQAVLARSFAFIYGRNQSNMALLGVTPRPFDEFYRFAEDGALVEIDLPGRRVLLYSGDQESAAKEFHFELSLMEERLLLGGGVTQLYQQYGRDLFRVAMSSSATATETTNDKQNCAAVHQPAINRIKSGGLVGLAEQIKAPADDSDKINKLTAQQRKCCADNGSRKESSW